MVNVVIFSKTFAGLSMLALMLGVSIGAFALSQNFALLKQHRTESDLGYAYFKILDVSRNASSSLDETLVSYIFIVNITNPTSEIVKIWDIGIRFERNVTIYVEKEHLLASSPSGIISLSRSFPREDTQYSVSPNSSKLFALTGVVAVPQTGLTALQQANTSVTLDLWGRTTGGAYVTSSIIKQVQLSILSSQEYVYRGIFASQRFRLRGDGPDVIIETGA